ncbi:MAG: hypothetical protein ACI9BW_001249 [Gammaproteobacteria bacterium]|jgi:hypothetical protein
MKKLITVIILGFALIGLTSNAAARGGHDRGYGHSYGHNYGHSSSHRNGRHSYGHSYGHRYNYGHRGYYGGSPFLWGPRIGYGYDPFYYQPRTIVIEREPPVYIQQPAAAVAAVPNVPTAPATQVWFYCPKPAGYYPHIQNCPEPWVSVDSRNVASSPPR